MNNLVYADVLDRWNDHVEADYYAPIEPETIGKLNNLFAQTHFADEFYGRYTRGAEIEPILRGRSLQALTEGEADRLIDLLVVIRDRDCS